MFSKQIVYSQCGGWIFDQHNKDMFHCQAARKFLMETENKVHKEVRETILGAAQTLATMYNYLSGRFPQRCTMIVMTV